MTQENVEIVKRAIDAFNRAGLGELEGPSLPTTPTSGSRKTPNFRRQEPTRASRLFAAISSGFWSPLRTTGSRLNKSSMRATRCWCSTVSADVEKAVARRSKCTMRGSLCCVKERSPRFVPTGIEPKHSKRPGFRSETLPHPPEERRTFGTKRRLLLCAKSSSRTPRMSDGRRLPR